MGIKQLNKKLDFLEEYKKRKVKSIGDETNRIKEKISFYKEVIIKTLQEHKEKTLSFPGSCKVTSKTPKADNWTIDDEEAFIEALKKENELDRVTEELTTIKIIKKEANKLLEDWKKSGKVPECVTGTPPKTSLTISYFEEEKNIEEDKVPTKDESTIDDFDQLDFS